MKLTSAVKQTLKYLTLENGIVGSIVDGVKKPKLEKYEVIADLHCHPCIKNLGDLLNTVRVCKRNNIGLCAIVQHFRGANPHDSKEMDYWQVLDMVKENVFYDGLSFELDGVKFIGGYEFYGTLKGVSGRLDLVPLLADEFLKYEIRKGESIENLMKICWRHNAVVIGAHPYTLWDPLVRGKFRLAYKEEREVIKEKLPFLVDTVDCPASNALWMLESNRLVKQDFKHPICTSDAHSKRISMRKELGRAGTIIDRDFLEGDLRTNFKEFLRYDEFRTYEGYMPALRFLGSIVL